MWSSFVTGFATQASKLIEDRDTEIQKQIDEQLELMNKEAAATKKKGETRRDTLKAAANQLISLGMPQEQVAAFISGADQQTLDATIKIMQKQATTQRGMPPELSRQMLSQFPETEETPEDVIERLSTPVAGTAPSFGEMRGAFGIRSGAARAAEKRATGLATELPEMPMATAPLDLTVFAEEDKPKGVVELENKLADKAVDAGVSVEDFRKTEEGKKIQAQIDGRNALAAERRGTEEEKARSASQINTSIALRLRERFQPLEMGQILQWNPDQFGGGTYSVLLPNDPAAIKYQKDRLGVVRQYFIDTGLIDAKGNIKGGRNAADAMYPYAEIDYDPQNLRVKSWRDTPLVPEGGAAPQESKPEAPATGAGRSRIGARAAQPVAPIPPVPTGQQAAGSGLPAPKTEEEYNALPSGTTYRHPDGTTKIKP